MSELRQRIIARQHQPFAEDASTPNRDEERETKIRTPPPGLEPDSYWLTRILFLRYLAFIYGVAFAVALNQNTQLIGRHGLTPLHVYLERLGQTADTARERLVRAPTVFWFVGADQVDFWLNATGVTGAVSPV